MKRKNATLYRSLGGIICAGTILVMATGAMGQNIFVANYDTDDIYEIPPGGPQSVFATGMNYPSGIAFNSSGDLFVANTDNNATGLGYITEIKPGQSPSTFASGINPQGLAVDGTGDVFTVDYRTGNLYEYPTTGGRITYASGFANPVALTIDSAGDLFVGAGYGNGNGYITEVTTSKTEISYASGLSFPYAMTFTSAGDLLLAQSGAASILEYTGPGSTPSVYASVTNPQGMAFDSAGNFYVATSGGLSLKSLPMEWKRLSLRSPAFPPG
jgi:secreted PhoX family phosphatase